VVAIGGGVILLYVFDSSLEFIYLASGLAMVVVGVMTASALKLGMWEQRR
jgi:hypothetical protein